MFILTLAIFLINFQTLDACPALCNCHDQAVYCNVQKVLTKEDIEIIGPKIPLNTIALTINQYASEDLSLKAFPVLPLLKELNIGYSNLSKVPNELSRKLPALSSLTLRRNKITRVSGKDFLGLRNLKDLRIFQNPLEEVSVDTFSDLLNLTYIDLQGNRLTSLDVRTFAGLEKLTIIDLTKNLIQSIPEYTFSSQKSLVELRLENNKIKKLFPTSFAGLSKLSVLYLNRNEINKLPHGLFNVFDNSKLIFYMNHNKIEKVPNELFRDGQVINIFGIANNKLSDIADKAFAETTFTTGLDLSSNNIKSIPPNAFRRTSISILALANNPLNCNCDFYKLLDVIQQGNKATNFMGSCHLPTSLAGLSISNSSAIKESQCTICDFNSTCLNSAHCVPLGGKSFTCKCLDGYKGDICQTKMKRNGQKELVFPLVGAFLALIFVIAIIFCIHWYMRRSLVGNRLQKEYSSINT
ncbi:slit homolog 1 protein-like [Hydractinia symbiolongicarpus]|uniref:slit homolog 1 protein-like n=1 Tax=Hydractinia symbiolongicarpus TaxID=13093 RepID=UPI00254A55F9|nr:slit homolog 1 protein-like [Hydractinia symbiolongicarpus]